MTDTPQFEDNPNQTPDPSGPNAADEVPGTQDPRAAKKNEPKPAEDAGPAETEAPSPSNETRSDDNPATPAEEPIEDESGEVVEPAAEQDLAVPFEDLVSDSSEDTAKYHLVRDQMDSDSQSKDPQAGDQTGDDQTGRDQAAPAHAAPGEAPQPGSPASGVHNDAAMVVPQPFTPVNEDPLAGTPFDEKKFPAADDATPVAKHAPPQPTFTPSIPPFLQNRPAEELPRRVEQSDTDGTQVTPAAYQGGTERARRAQQRYLEQKSRQNRSAGGPPEGQATRPVQRQLPPPSSQPVFQRRIPPATQSRTSYSTPIPAQVYTPPPAQTRGGQGGGGAVQFWGCLGRTILWLVIAGIILAAAGVSFVVFQYYSIARNLPDIEGLKTHASQFETTRILDRNGNVLYEIIDPNAGRRTYIPLKNISPYLIAATIATEDKDFYNNPGFDPVGIVRAFYQNYTSGTVVSGASTITQQLARMLLFGSEEASQRTYQRKIREVVLASEITRRYSKEEILELYLNEIYYGNIAYGIEAASETYFDTSADKLNLAQAAFLAGLPQAPSVYDIFTNRDEALKRHKQVLVLMYELSREKNCIEISTGIQRVCVDAAAATAASQEIENRTFQVTRGTFRYPHWVNYIRALLEKQFDAQTIYRSGFTVYTTLDPVLQDKADEIVKKQISGLSERNVKDGALVALRPKTGEILAMVGSADFDNADIAGQINMALVPRQPGSSIKPLTYLAAFEKGWTPSTLIWDVPSEFPPSGDPSDTRAPYVPVDYDGRFRGPVTVRAALANSLNIPAVKTLQFVGIYDNPSTAQSEGLIGMANRLGITTLTRNDYGLALTLGGGEVTLLEMTSAFGTFANGGQRLPPVAITKIVDFSGKVIYSYKQPSPEQIIRPEHAYLISSILSDNDARTPSFGPNSVLKVPFPAAVKTGTTNDFRDNWTLGYTPDVAVGVWIGNADYTPMEGISGVTGAAPIWAEFIQVVEEALTGGNGASFSRPAGIVERVVCSGSGTEPSEWCPSQRSEVFAADQLPPNKDSDLWKKVQVDTWTGLAASPDCSGYNAEKFAINVSDPSALKWIQEQDAGKDWARGVGFEEPFFFVPKSACKSSDPRPNIYFAGMAEDSTISTSPLDIYAAVDATSQFTQFRLEWGPGNDPGEWKELVGGLRNTVPKPDRIYTWDLKDVPEGNITLRIYMEGQDGRYAEKRLHLKIHVPTPTPTSTPTSTPTLTPSITPSITPSPTPTITPSPTETPSPTPPSETPTLTPGA